MGTDASNIPNSNSTNSHASTNSHLVPSRRFTRTGCWVIGSGVSLMVLVIAFGVHRWVTPEVDASATPPVVVSSNTPAENGTDSDTPVDANGSITATINQKMIDQADHPFDPLLIVAKLCLEEIDAEIADYTATMVSQVRVGDRVMDEKYLFCKIRHARTADDTEIPFSVYTLFLKPESNVGQEAIWVDGWNDGDLIAHATGLLNVKRFKLNPDGSIAMRGNRYPIREIGFRNLLAKMVKIGEKDREHGECQVTIERNIKINDRVCTVLKVVHPERRDHFEFHMAKIYIDDEWNIPVAYEGYLWPEKEGDELPLLEKYFYTNVQLNVGLTDADFDAGNEEYGYPGW